MPLRRRLVLASSPVRALTWATLAAVYMGGLGLLIQAGTPWWVFTVVMVAAAAAWVPSGGEQWEQRRFGRKLGWTGDPKVALLVRADVDAGRVPRDDATLHELARRYATDALQRQRAAPVVAVVYGLIAVVFVGLEVANDGTPRSALGALLLAAFFQYQAWIRLPRYSRVLTLLNGTTVDHDQPPSR